MGKTPTRWTPTDAELEGLTVERARDLIVTCFFEAQKETLMRARTSSGRATDLAQVRRDVETIVRIVFKEHGVSFDKPTVETLNLVVMTLAKKAESWGTPREVIEHHKASLAKMFALLPRTSERWRT